MTIKIVNVNSWWGGRLMPQLIAFLREQDAGIVTLQEVYNAADPNLDDRYRTVEVLQTALGYKHTDFAQVFIHDGPAGLLPQGSLVLSKFPIRDRSLQYLTPALRESYEDIPELWPEFPRELQRVELDTSAGPVNVFNMHGVWDLDGDSYSPARQKMSQDILQAIKDKPNVILTGDTNAKASNQAMLDLETQLTSVFGQSLTTTFNMRHKDNPGYATAAVDLMFVSPGIKIISKDCPDVDISDHLPIVATLSIEGVY